MRAELDRPLRIGSFSAASNVTGIVTDTIRVTKLLHEHGALSFWDFAAAAPYVDVTMCPADEPMAHKDAVFLSPHKLIGGFELPDESELARYRRNLKKSIRFYRTRRRFLKNRPG